VHPGPSGSTDRHLKTSYRTAVNLANDTLLAFEEANIVGVKDSSGNLAQSLKLLRRRQPGLL
jgi:dihydrodipicolinate synthase/N-acetylneuraminate lyase